MNRQAIKAAMTACIGFTGLLVMYAGILWGFGLWRAFV
jgi:hypothetical protein